MFDPHAQILIGEETLNLANKRKPIVEEGAFTLFFDSFTDKSFFTGVSVELTTDKTSQAEVTFVDEDHALINSCTREDGVRPLGASIYLGYGQQMGEPVFEGLLAAVEHSGHKTTLCFYDRGLRMKLEEKTEYHKGLDIDVMKTLVERNGLNFVLADKTIKGLRLKSDMQQGETDWDYLLGLARDAGLVVWVRGGTLFVARPARVGEPVLTLDERDQMLLEGESLRYEMPENAGSPASVEVRYRDRGGKRGSGFSIQRQRGRKKVITRQSINELSKSEAQRRAQAIYDLESEPSFTCQVRTLFLPSTRHVTTRQTVWLLNRGKLFSGLYLVDSVHMNLEAGSGMTMDFDLVRDALSCKELLQIPNARDIYPDAWKRCQERQRRVTR